MTSMLSVWGVWSRMGLTSTRTAVIGKQEVAQALQLQTVRFKGGILPHKKPRWIPPARSKMFKNPPQYFAPESEIVQRNILKVRYQEHYSALVQYLYEDYLKNSAVGEAAKVEAQREQEEHERMMQENQEENALVAKLREERLQREREETLARIEREKQEFAVKKEEKKRRVAEIVKAETESLERRVTKEDLERSILQALENETDHEYAIDREGHIYRGRYTKSVLVPEAERERIPVPPNKFDLLRQEKKEN